MMHACHCLPRIIRQLPRAGARARAGSRVWTQAAGSTATHHAGTLFVLDVLPFVYKAIHLAGAAAGSSEGQPQQQEQQQQQQRQWEAGPTHDCMMLLLDLINRKSSPPTHMAVVVDVPGPNWRHLKYPQYKAQRPPPPPQLMAEVSRLLSLVDALGMAVLAVPGVEADDVAGSLAVRAVRDGFDVVLVSTDKDFYQLLRPGLSVLRGTSPSAAPFTLSDFEAQYGLPPGLWPDFKALAGDAGDNVPGVRGVGERTALQLVQQLGDVESILGCLRQQQQQLEGKVKLNKPQLEMLCSEDGAAAARLAKELTTIVTDLKAPPVRQPWSVFELKPPADGGSLAVQRAQQLNLPWTGSKLQSLMRSWGAGTAGAAAQ